MKVTYEKLAHLSDLGGILSVHPITQQKWFSFSFGSLDIYRFVHNDLTVILFSPEKNHKRSLLLERSF